MQTTRAYSLGLLAALAPSISLFAENGTSSDASIIELAPFTLIADRLATPDGAENQAFVRWVESDKIGTLKLDSGHDLSESLARFSNLAAFRSSPSRIAHPTTQGMKVRNIGANASSRALVTYDGIPQNDPFGGWIYWHRYQNAAIAAVALNPSGGGETWGNLGSGGAISIISDRPQGSHGQYSLVAGDQDTYAASLAVTQQINDNASIDISGKHFETSGDWILAPEQRGAIDEKAGSEADAIRVRVRNVSDNWTLSLSSDWFEESRKNGTPAGRNTTESYDFAFTASHSLSENGSRFSTAAYFQKRDFANVFASVSDQRDSERPALDQFDVPADAQGASVSYYAPLEDGGFLLIGADVRDIDGEVNERFRNLGNGFTRLRKAGGEQTFIGAFGTWNRILDTANEIKISARIENTNTSNGFRQEQNLETDSLIRNDSHASQSETELSASVAWSHSFNEQRTFRAKAFTGFRAPTLNELYRPFRVKNDIIEANPMLENERLWGIDATFAIDIDESSKLTASAFFVSAEDLVANATLSTQSGFNPLCGFVPGGGSCGQRLNIGRSEISGIEIDYSKRLSSQWALSLDFVYADTQIKDFSELPSVEGNPLPQAPRARGQFRLDYQANDRWDFWIRGKAWSHTHEDLAIQRRIDNGYQFDFSARIRVADQTALSLRIDNLTDRLNQSGLATSGLIAITPGRSAWLSWDQAF